MVSGGVENESVLSGAVATAVANGDSNIGTARSVEISVSINSNETKPSVTLPSELPHLAGARTLIALWVLCHHMAPRNVTSVLSPLTMRVDVGVEFFMLLSGFVLHYSYCDKRITADLGSLASFYVRRLARVVLTSQVSILVSTFNTLVVDRNILFSIQTIECLFLVRTWVNPELDFPNSPAWFIMALIPSWLLYPLITHRVLTGPLCASPRNLLCLSVILWSVSIGPQILIIIARGSWLTWNDVKMTWFWPPAQIADFALGSCVAALVRKAPPSRSTGVIADSMVAIVLVACVVVPLAEPPVDWKGPLFRPGHFVAWDALSGRCAAVFLATFLYFSAGTGSAVARALSHPALASLGKYTLEVYLFQSPVHDWFVGLGSWMSFPEVSVEVFMFYLFIVWFASILWVDLLATPADMWLRGVTSTWLGRNYGLLCGQGQPV
eukprot:TRINITY_DN8054_c0_g1_i1.p1 TRINITY_DN8054_c0_g1~~TRINITY_DN8054_c0_g1_i1.p1  ORF type:complete len:497 (+),score=44.73 TRINITY_DN8054_c0_g1_i1:176-1492(+)